MNACTASATSCTAIALSRSPAIRVTSRIPDSRSSRQDRDRERSSRSRCTGDTADHTPPGRAPAKSSRSSTRFEKPPCVATIAPGPRKRGACPAGPVRRWYRPRHRLVAPAGEQLQRDKQQEQASGALRRRQRDVQVVQDALPEEGEHEDHHQRDQHRLPRGPAYSCDARATCQRQEDRHGADRVHDREQRHEARWSEARRVDDAVHAAAALAAARSGGHQAGRGPPNGISTSGGPMPETSRRIQSSRSSSIAEAGRSTTHSQRPPASPAKTERSSSASDGRRWRPATAARTGCRSVPGPAVARRPARGPGRGATVPAHRAPRPTPGLLADHEHVDRPVEGAGPRAAGHRRAPGPRSADHREVADRPARAHRPGQVGREVAGRGQRLDERVVRRLHRAAAAAPSGRARGTTSRRPAPSGRPAWGSAGTPAGATCAPRSWAGPAVKGRVRSSSAGPRGSRARSRAPTRWRCRAGGAGRR